MFIFETEIEAIKHAENFLLGNPEFSGFEVFDCIHGWSFTATVDYEYVYPPVSETEEDLDLDDLPF